MMKSRGLKRALLASSQALFLWMFFSTSALEYMADANQFGSDPTGELRTRVYQHAAEWRHGLTGFWPVYVPGFFAVAIATWVWSLARPLRHLLPELLALSGAAAVLALLLAPAGTELALRDLRSEVGLKVGGSVPLPPLSAVAAGLYSLLAWNAFTLACNRALWWRTLWPLCVPAAMDAVLFFIRPYTFDTLVSTWLGRAADGNATALLWLLAAPVTSIFMVWAQIRSERLGSQTRPRFTPLKRASCFLFGHRVDNRCLEASAERPACRCGAAYLHTDGRTTRVAHTLVCFFGGHHYRFAGARDEYHEYVCVRCGHPLLLQGRTNQPPTTGVFRKSVNYRHGVFGHQVAQVTERNGSVEYACLCGHSFLRGQYRQQTIRHPLICVFRGHFICFAVRRFGFAEFVCLNCGHPFSFRVGAEVQTIG